jgi:phenylacetate-CoA ligase
MEVAMPAGALPLTEFSGPLDPISSLDYLPRAQLRGLQTHRLRQLVATVYERVPLYRQRMLKQGLTPEDVRSLEDLGRLPFTAPDDLYHEYPGGMRAVPIRAAARLVAVCGPGGRQGIVPYTRRDLELWHEILRRALAGCGVGRDDVVLVASPLAACLESLPPAIEALGAVALSVASVAELDRRAALLKDLDVSVVCATADDFEQLIRYAGQAGVDLHGLAWRVGVLLGQPTADARRHAIETAAGIRLHDAYGPMEILGPGVATECGAHDGLHLVEDHFLPEVIDPQTGEPMAEGQEGELVLTALDREAMPLVRYRTSEHTAIVAGACPCGRSLRRIRRLASHGGPPPAAKDAGDLAAGIEKALCAVHGHLPPYRTVFPEEGGPRPVEVQIEITPQIFRDQVGALENLQGRLAEEIQRSVGLRLAVRFVEPHAIRRGTRS